MLALGSNNGEEYRADFLVYVFVCVYVEGGAG